MDYVSKLTDDELRELCGIIPLQHFRDCFKGNPQQFHKIWPSCRPEKVSPEIVEKLAVGHRDAPFVSDVLNTSIRALLDIMQDKLAVFIGAGDDKHTALLRLLLKSMFCGHVDLYLKLADPSYTPEYSELLQCALREIEGARKAAEDAQAAAERNNAAEDELEKLRGELAEARKELEERQAKETEQNTAYAELEKELWKKKQELAGLQNLMDHADFSTDDPIDEKYPYVSLCRVDKESVGTAAGLFRLADMSDGVIQDRWRDDFPSRNYLYTQNPFPSKDSVGVWGWRMEYNPNSGQDNRVVSEFLPNQRPVQIILVPNCETVEALKESLLQGVDSCPDGSRALFSFFDGGKYVGLLCEAKNLLQQGGTVALKPSVTALSLYEFSEQEIVKFGRLWFFYRVNLGIAQERVQITDPVNIIKRLLREGPATMKKLRPIFGSTTSQKIREFLNAVPTTDFYKSVADACDSSLEESRSYVDDFIQRADIYLGGEDVETEVLEAALEHSPVLLEKCRALNEERWRREHSEQMESARSELEKIAGEARREAEERSRLSEEHQRLEDQLKVLASGIAQKEQLVKDVEERVAGRIAAARKNAADFLCEMAFAYPEVMGHAASAAPAESALFQPGECLDNAPSDLHDDWDVVCAIQDELERAGVSEKRSMSFAAFLYAAYTLRTPLLLAGPNGRDIANALSAALFGRRASVLRCGNDYLPGAVEACLCGEEQIAVIMNPLHSGWIDHISELSGRKEKLLIIVHPFAEDLLIEPRGLYSYALPVLTELFVDRAPAGDFRGGRFADGFADYIHAAPQKRIPLADKIAMPSLVQRRLCQLLADVKELTKNKSADDDFLFGVVPYAYVTGKAGVLREELQGGHALSKETRAAIQTLLGETE